MKRINNREMMGDLFQDKEHSKSRVGDLSEFYAVTWLWDQGYEVFPNAGSQGMADMIAWHPATENFMLIDVKTIQDRSKKQGDPTRTKRQASRNIKILLYNKDTRQLRFVEHKDE
tara:strand:- start:211 stop:555 length:345 start_codon:yes stop_codon:yes gene_type:complete